MAKKGKSGGPDSLRSMAEKRLDKSSAIPEELTEAEAKKLLHELQVHQIELEMQNEELRKAQAEIEESRSRYADLYDFSPVGYVTLDRSGKILNANLTAAGMLGVERSYLVRSFFQKYIVCKNTDSLLRHIANATEAGAGNSFELTLKSRSGGDFVVLMDCILVEGPEGKESFMASLTDITARKVAEDALKRAQDERLQSILDNSTTVIYVKDLGGRYLFVNSRYEALFHVKKEEIKGKTDYDIFTKKAADVYRANDLEVVRSKAPLEFEEVALQEDGQHTYLSVKFPLFGANGKVDATCGISTDISDRKRLEDEVLKTQKLESIGVLAGGIAHDFNNLLTGIIGNLSLLESRVYDDKYTFDRLMDVERAATQAQELTKQLLTFSKGGTPIKETVSIGSLIMDSVPFSLRGSNVRFESSISDDLWFVDADAGQIAQCMNNLSINAVQAMPDGGVLRVSACNRTITDKDGLPVGDGRFVEITVEDHGTGIPVESLSKIFDPYFTTKPKGSGLGLASVYSIISKHDGHIDASSEVGVGTTFRIFLPASKVGAAVKPEKPNAEKAVTADGRVLVMDDEEIIRDVATVILSDIGYKIQTAKDGKEAIRLYEGAMERGEPFDVVIMDLTIPGGMGGKEAIKSLLAYDPEVRVLVSSGYSNDPIMADYKKYGFRGVVTKPYKATELGAKVHRVITGD